MKNPVHPERLSAIVKNGRIVYIKGLGVKSAESGDPIDIHTAFRIASVSKTFAGVLTSKLVSQGKLDWEDPVQKYVPDFQLQNPDYASLMKIKHILSQSTGLVQHAYTNYIEIGKDYDFMFKSLKEVQLIAPPGKIFTYQNLVFSAIEPVIKSATGSDYTEMLKREIFEPLNMTDASIDYASMMANENKAFPLMPRKTGWKDSKIEDSYYVVASAGGVNASISDMANYMIALTGHRPQVISEKMLQDIFTPQISTDIRWRYFSKWKAYKKSYYGLGWRVVENGNSTIAYHGGYVNGYRSQLAVNKADDIAICVLTNSPSDYSSDLIPAFLKLFDEQKEEIIAEMNPAVSMAQ
ncbi:MAG: serine hydrolase [Cyclobacteriaceae bacterium]|nr:serine hydrolase [Cyclobacteriaceae bacterium]